MSTINDVAKRAGVAVSTVSKVLRKYPNVSEETREKVMTAIDELDYVPNSIASALSSKKYDRVGLIIFFNNQRQAIDEINMQYLFGAFDEAYKQDVKVVTYFSSVMQDWTSDEIIRNLRADGVTGIIVYGLSKKHKTMQEVIDKNAFASVVVDAPQIGERTSSVMVDHERAQYEIAKRLVEKNNLKKVLYIAGDKYGYVTELRLSGMFKLQKELGLDLSVEYAKFSERKANELVKNISDDIDGVICGSDLMALGAKNALKERGEFKPICGYDGITLMGYAGQHIETVKQDFYEISKTAIDEMKRLFDGNEGRMTLVDHEIVIMKYEDIIT